MSKHQDQFIILDYGSPNDDYVLMKSFSSINCYVKIFRLKTLLLLLNQIHYLEQRVWRQPKFLRFRSMLCKGKTPRETFECFWWSGFRRRSWRCDRSSRPSRDSRLESVAFESWKLELGFVTIHLNLLVIFLFIVAVIKVCRQ